MQAWIYRKLDLGMHMMAMEQAEEVAREFVAFRRMVEEKGLKMKDV
jgi:hypothetical protein